jgi:hypothetical protein
MPSITAEEPDTGAAAHHRRAHAMDTAPPAVGATGARGILLPVAIVLVIGSIFVSVYLAAFHAPTPHRLPVAVVGSEQTLSRVEQGLDKGQSGGFTVRGYPSEAEARTALADRQVYAAYIAGGATPELLYAGANGSGVTATLTGAFGAVAAAEGQHLAPRDAVPAAAGDSRGLSVFYAAFGVVLAGFLYGTMTYQIAPRLEYRLRMLSLGTFGVLGGVVVALVAGRGFSAIPGPFLGVAGVVGLMAAAAGAATMTLLRLFGPAGVTLATITLLILGNASGGGVLPAAFLPSWLHPLHSILPVGVGVRAIQGISYFNSDGLSAGVTVLAAWTVACAIVLYVRDVWSVRLLSRTA